MGRQSWPALKFIIIIISQTLPVFYDIHKNIKKAALDMIVLTPHFWGFVMTAAFKAFVVELFLNVFCSDWKHLQWNMNGFDSQTILKSVFLPAWFWYVSVAGHCFCLLQTSCWTFGQPLWACLVRWCMTPAPSVSTMPPPGCLWTWSPPCPLTCCMPSTSAWWVLSMVGLNYQLLVTKSADTRMFALWSADTAISFS